jgi:adenylate kinase
VYATETAPLLEYYAGHIMAINAVGDVQEVHQRILGALGDN